MSPVQLVDFSQLNKQELPLQRPGPYFAIPVLVGGPEKLMCCYMLASDNVVVPALGPVW